MEQPINYFAVWSFFSLGALLFACSLFSAVQRKIMIRLKILISLLFTALGFLFFNQGGIYLHQDVEKYRQFGIGYAYTIGTLSVLIVIFLIRRNKKLKREYSEKH